MKKADKQRPDDEAQSKRFIEAAKKVQADETKEGADRAFRRLTDKSRQSRPAAKPKGSA